MFVIVFGDYGLLGFLYGKCNFYDFGIYVFLVIFGLGVLGG